MLDVAKLGAESAHHAEEALAGVLELEVLVGELVAIDGLSARAVSFGKVASNRCQ